MDGAYFRGCYFRTFLEARWAAFFAEHGDDCRYAPDGWPIGNEKYYTPQLKIRDSLYLEVRDEWDPHTRRPLRDYEPEIEEHSVFLAVGDLPTQGQLLAVGWWDQDNKRGVLQLTRGYEWDSLFPPGSDAVLAALETARTIPLIPTQQRRIAGEVTPQQRTDSEQNGW